MHPTGAYFKEPLYGYQPCQKPNPSAGQPHARAQRIRVFTPGIFPTH